MKRSVICLIAVFAAICGNVVIAYGQNNPFRNAGSTTENRAVQPANAAAVGQNATSAPEPSPLQPVPTGTGRGKRPSSESLLPPSTKAWISIPNANSVAEKFDKTNLGKLAALPELSEFSAELKKRFNQFIDERNFRLGITWNDVKEVRTGEVAVAGVFEMVAPEAANKSALGTHGIVLLVDVAGNEPAANELLKKVSAELQSFGATKEKGENLLGFEINRWKVPRRKDPNLKFDTYQTIADGWLVATDNPSVLREVLLRIKNDANATTYRSLIDNESFAAIQERCRMADFVPEVRWFIEPFGYVDLAQAIREQESILRKRKHDYAGKLRQNGFDALRGIGGMLAINEGDFDLAYRVFAYTAGTQNVSESRRRALEILDLRNTSQDQLQPNRFVSSEYSHIAVTWNMLKAYDNIGPLVDAFGGEDFFTSFEKSFIDDIGVNLRSLIARLGSKIGVVSSARFTSQDSLEDTERMAIVVPLTGGADDHRKFLAEIQKLLKIGKPQTTASGLVYLEDSRDAEDPVEEQDLRNLKLDRFKQFEEPTNEKKEDEQEGVDFKVFKRRFFAIVDGQFVIASHLDILEGFTAEKVSQQLVENADFLYTQAAIDQYVDPKRVSLRGFGRLDRQLKTNYDAFRSNKMGQSQTSLARLLNRLLSVDSEDPNYVRQQRIDGHSLPENFDGLIAPYLGFSGMALESQDDGWLMTGGILKKKGMSEVVRKQEEKERR